MASIKEKPSTGGLIAGISGILCFALPAAIGSLEGVLYGVWMWGLYSGSLEGVVVTLFLPDAPGLIVSIIILCAAIILCITYIKVRKELRNRTVGIIWIILGAIILLSIILYLIFRWTILLLPGIFFNLAIYLSFWAGTSALMSGIYMTREIISKEGEDTRVIDKAEREKWGLDEEQPDCPDCQLARTHSYDICPYCNKKLK